MPAPTILIVEDDVAIREMLRFVLQQENFDIVEAEDAEYAQAQIDLIHPSLILLDWMLPGMSGVEFARRLKRGARTRNIPIVLITARGEETDKVKGLESGADDYVTKPFSTRELVARIRAVLRRSSPHESNEVVESGGLTLNPIVRQVFADGKVVDLGPTEFKLLHFFITHEGRVYERGQLLDLVWGVNTFVEERTVDVSVRRLRHALEPHGCDNLLQTVRGFGYRFSST